MKNYILYIFRLFRLLIVVPVICVIMSCESWCSYCFNINNLTNDSITIKTTSLISSYNIQIISVPLKLGRVKY